MYFALDGTLTQYQIGLHIMSLEPQKNPAQQSGSAAHGELNSPHVESKSPAEPARTCEADNVRTMGVT